MKQKTGTYSFRNALGEHARFAAQRARNRLGGVLTAQNLYLFLSDRQCVRHPTTIVFDRNGLEPHQFAQPVHCISRKGILCELHVDPRLKNVPDALYLVVAYMTAVINYGETVTADIAEMTGALLTGMNQETFYKRICEIADFNDCATHEPGAINDSGNG